MFEVAVVGAGHNGLVCAALLERAGLEVAVVETGAVGGAVRSAELLPGHVFSTCAYALHLLHERVMDELRVELDLIGAPPRIAVLPDGEVWRDDLPDGWDGAWEELARRVDPFVLGDAPAFDDELTVAGLLDRHARSDEERAVLAPPFLECDPREPGSALAHAYIETSRVRAKRLQGIPRGGMGQLTRALLDATSAPIVREATAPVVVRTDPQPASHTERALQGTRLHFSLAGTPDVSRLVEHPRELGVVFLLPSLDWYLTGEPFLELQIPTFLDDTLAPPGRHNLSVYVPRGRITPAQAVERASLAIPNLPGLVDGVAEIPLPTPIHHAPHHPACMWANRPGPRLGERRYLGGAGAHPGGEVSGAPGWNAAQAVLADLRDR
jgi:phytoene dehydrogenase-like protein